MFDRMIRRRVGFGFLTSFPLALAAVVLSVLTIAPIPAHSQGAGDIVVAPTRIVFEGRERSAKLTLANKGSATATYRVTVVNMAMDDAGNLTEVKEPAPGQMFAGDLFRYSPRQVTLQPGETQAVRFLLRKPKDLKDGEYRSHIMMRAIPKEGGESIEQTQTANGVQIRLIPIYGITIPVIVRQGTLGVTAKLADLAVLPADADNPQPRLTFRIDRDGDRSTYGDLTAVFKPKGGGEELVVGQIMRLAVYTPNPTRTVTMTLRVPEGTKLANGSLALTYRKIEDEGGAVMAEQTITLP